MEHFINKKIICKTADDTKQFAKKIANVLCSNSRIALIGDLGCGKTTFVKGLAEGLGIIQNVSSPSFNILNIYNNGVNLLHVDAYRLDGSQFAANGLMLDDFLLEPYCLVVEWPENLFGFLDICDFKINFSILENSDRGIFIQKNA